jgi:dTDP-4-dehydrorhamnose 3,5-epimerase
MDMAPTYCNCCGSAFSDLRFFETTSLIPSNARNLQFVRIKQSDENRPMKKIATSLPGLLLLEPRVFGDDRGFFLESYNQRTFAELGIPDPFVQDNHSYSEQNVIRGLHYQIRQPQGKLVRAITGEILDVALDLRRSSPTLGKWESFKLSGENKHILWIPRGFAHGFRVVSQTAHVLYKTTDFYAPEHERTVAWNDSALDIVWEVDGEPAFSAIVSARDQQGVPFEQAEKFE